MESNLNAFNRLRASILQEARALLRHEMRDELDILRAEISALEQFKEDAKKTHAKDQVHKTLTNYFTRSKQENGLTKFHT